MSRFPFYALYLVLDPNKELSSFNLTRLFCDLKSVSIFPNSLVCLSDFFWSSCVSQIQLKSDLVFSSSIPPDIYKD